MSYFSFNNIKVSGIACAVPKNVVRTDSYKPTFGEEEVNKFMDMTMPPTVLQNIKHVLI